MSTENEQLLNLITEQTRVLLKNHWPDILEFRDGLDCKFSFAHTLRFEGDKRSIKTSIFFSRRIKDEVTDWLDLGQAELPLKGKHGNSP
jgi:hypothetical protein